MSDDKSRRAAPPGATQTRPGVPSGDEQLARKIAAIRAKKEGRNGQKK